jgi:DNA (cytosine-5)-methyltransferase 1
MPRRTKLLSRVTNRRGAVREKDHDFRVIDLFSGCGGMTLGFEWNSLAATDTNPIVQSQAVREYSPFRSVFANDFDAGALATYRENFDPSGSHSDGRPIEQLLEDSSALPHCDVVIGGPPCQGFSLLNKWRSGDYRRSLWWHFLEVADRTGAKIVVMENVPQLLGSPEFQAIWSRLRGLGFRHSMAHVLCAANHGVAQVRNRAIIIASRVGPVALPLPTHLSPRRMKIAREAAFANRFAEWRTVREAIGGLGRPVGTEIRLNDGAEESLHFGRRPTEESVLRYKAVPPGGNRFDLQRNAPELTPDCWIRKTSGGTDLFGRLWWNRPSVTIRTEFFKPEKGRYLHPTANRPITHREAARIQSFPDSFAFKGSKIEIAKQIGNAVPPLLARAIAFSVRDALQGRTDEVDMLKCRDSYRTVLGERVDAIAIESSEQVRAAS